jgi:hypothetical protein
MSPRLKRPTLDARSIAIDGITATVLLIGAGIIAVDARIIRNLSPLRTMPCSSTRRARSRATQTCRPWDSVLTGAYSPSDQAAIRVRSSVVTLTDFLDGNTENRRVIGPGRSCL